MANPASHPDPQIPDFPNPETSAPHSRYSRQILFPGIGPAGQDLLARARVAIIGVGATGAATASLLARAGVGHLTLIDRDIVEPSNLQRQILFDERDAANATPKAEAARAKIALFNSSIQVEAHVTDLIPANIHTLLAQAHLLLDCTDNFETRYLLNDYAVQQTKPWIYAGAVAAQAATMTILPRPPGIPGTPGAPAAPAAPTSDQRTNPSESTKGLGAPSQSASSIEVGSPPTQSPAPTHHVPLTTHHSPYLPTACLACLFPTPPTGPLETCDTAGILSMAVNLAASLQSAEALKILTNQSHLIRRTFLSIDLWSNQRAELSTSTPDPACPVCAQRIFTHLAGTARPHITLCGRNSVQIHQHHRPLDLPALAATLRTQPDLADLRATPHLLRFRRGPHTVTVFPDGRALIQGTTDPALARSLYARFLGA